MHDEDTEEPPDDVEELNEIIEFGRRADDFRSGMVPTNELRNFGAVRRRQKEKKFVTLHETFRQIYQSTNQYLFQVERS